MSFTTMQVIERAQQEFRFLQLRPCDLEPPADSPIPRMQFISTRLASLKIVDQWIQLGFQARRKLMEKLQAIPGGTTTIRDCWSKLVVEDARKDHGRPAMVIAQASWAATKAMESADLVDMLTDSYMVGRRPETRKVKWPAFGITSPELSPWVLVPLDSSSSVDALVGILERQCPELATEKAGTNVQDIFDEQSLALFLQYCSYSKKDSNSPDPSMGLRVRDSILSSESIRLGAARLVLLGTFFLCFVDILMDRVACCFFCNKKQLENMKRCSRCHSVNYCSRECQVNDFQLPSSSSETNVNSHKKECSILQELYSRYDGEDALPQHDLIGVYMTCEGFMYPKLLDLLPEFKASVAEKLGLPAT